MLSFLPRHDILPFCTRYLHTNLHVFTSWDFFSTVCALATNSTAQRSRICSASPSNTYILIPRSSAIFCFLVVHSHLMLLSFQFSTTFLLTRISKYDPIYYDVLPPFRPVPSPLVYSPFQGCMTLIRYSEHYFIHPESFPVYTFRY